MPSFVCACCDSGMSCVPKQLMEFSITGSPPRVGATYRLYVLSGEWTRMVSYCTHLSSYSEQVFCHLCLVPFVGDCGLLVSTREHEGRCFLSSRALCQLGSTQYICVW